MQKSAPNRFLVLGSLLAVQVLFGASYLASKLIVGRWPPLVWAAVRVDASALLMLAIALGLRRPRPVLNREFLWSVAGAALFGMVITQASFLVGLTYTSATNSAVLNTLIPLFTALLVAARGQEPFSGGRVAGLALSLAGVLVLCRAEEFNWSSGSGLGDALTLVNCLSSAIFLTFAKPFLTKHDPVWATAWIFLFGGLALTVVAIPQWNSFHGAGIDAPLACAMAFAILGATLLAYFLNFWALAHAGSTHVALFIYAQPVVAALLAWAAYGEAITARTLGATALVFTGLFLGLRRASPRRKIPGRVEIGGVPFPLADLSRDGFGFFAPPGAEFFVGVETPAILLLKGSRIETRATVIMITRVSGRKRLGCRFAKLPQESDEALLRVLE